jgi:hypothetical protein
MTANARILVTPRITGAMGSPWVIGASSFMV